jgi:hypothetical protein
LEQHSQVCCQQLIERVATVAELLLMALGCLDWNRVLIHDAIPVDWLSSRFAFRKAGFPRKRMLGIV